MSQPNDLSRSPVALEQDKTLIAVIEMSQSSWLVAGIVPGVERQPLKAAMLPRHGDARPVDHIGLDVVGSQPPC